MIDSLTQVKTVRLSDHFLHRAKTQFRHDLAQLLGDEEEIVDDVFWLAHETLTQLWILSGHAHRAGVEMTLAHHDTAFRNEGRGGETELVRAQQGADGHVAARAHAAVHLHADTRAQAVEHQGLVGFRQANLPGGAGMLGGGQGRGAGAAIETGNGHVIRMGLGNARGHRAHTHFGDQLHGDACFRIHVLQIVDELGQILDGINVVMRWW